MRGDASGDESDYLCAPITIFHGTSVNRHAVAGPVAHVAAALGLGPGDLRRASRAEHERRGRIGKQKRYDHLQALVFEPRSTPAEVRAAFAAARLFARSLQAGIVGGA